MTRLEPLMERNFLEYASYVVVDRAIPDIRDGLKPVQRRILATLLNMDDGKFHKVANVIGETMKLHPHGDASIGDALVVLANKEYFIDKQGNFGNPVTGHPAAAARYIECRLTELAREALFSKALTTYRPSYDGRREEPIFLPAKLPVALMLGTDGIAVGMATKILPHNFKELLEAQIALLKHESIALYPDFPTGGIVDASEYADGRGKIRVRARIEKTDDKTIVIREVPYSTNTENLIASIEAAAQKGKVKIASINDYTTDRVEIEICLPRGIYADEVIPQLYAYTECESSISSNITLIRDRHPVELTVTEVLRFLTDQLRDQIGAELQHELDVLGAKKHWLSLERIFIEQRVYKRIEKAKTAEAVRIEVYDGLKPFFDQLERPVEDEDVKRLLEIPIRRISAYDIEKNRREIEDTEIEIVKVEGRLKRLTQTTIKYLKDLLEKYGPSYRRRTELARFQSVDVRSVARQNIKVGYDPESGFFGSEVKTADQGFTVTEYDRFLAVARDGSYRIVGPDDKILLAQKLLYLDVLDQEKGKAFTVIYRDNDRIPYGKRVHIKRFIRDREYELIKAKEGKIDLLLPGNAMGTLQLDFVPAKRQRVKEAEFDLSGLEFMGTGARGRRLAPKPVAKIKYAKADARESLVPPPDLPDDEGSPGAEPEAEPEAQPAAKGKGKDKGGGGEGGAPNGRPGGGRQFSLFD